MIFCPQFPLLAPTEDNQACLWQPPNGRNSFFESIISRRVRHIRRCREGVGKRLDSSNTSQLQFPDWFSYSQKN